MKTLARLLAVTLLTFGLSACLFKEAVFTSGFQKNDASLPGVWVSEDDSGDPRAREYAVLVPMSDEACMLHYPSGGRDGSYFEVRSLQVQGRTVWQLRLAATFGDGLPSAESPTYTLAWVDKIGEGKLSIRSLKTEGEHTADPAAVKKALEDKATDWNKLFGEAKVFLRLRDQ